MTFKIDDVKVGSYYSCFNRSLVKGKIVGIGEDSQTLYYLIELNSYKKEIQRVQKEDIKAELYEIGEEVQFYYKPSKFTAKVIGKSLSTVFLARKVKYLVSDFEEEENIEIPIEDVIELESPPSSLDIFCYNFAFIFPFFLFIALVLFFLVYK